MKKGHRYASIVIDAVTGARIDVVPDQRIETVTAWLRAHPVVLEFMNDLLPYEWPAAPPDHLRAPRASRPRLVRRSPPVSSPATTGPTSS
jgi:hypothetical protein